MGGRLLGVRALRLSEPLSEDHEHLPGDGRRLGEEAAELLGREHDRFDRRFRLDRRRAWTLIEQGHLAAEVTRSVRGDLATVDLRCDDGRLASGTSTDAVVVAATGRGPRCRFGGPISDFGWVVARAAREALDAGIRRWIEEHP